MMKNYDEVNVIMNEYSCSDTKEKEYLINKGIRYSFVKVINGRTVWKFTNNKELFIALAEYHL